RPARSSFLTRPWLLNRIASGGPEIVVTEYSTPNPIPNGRPNSRSHRIGRPRPGAWARVSRRMDGVGRKLVTAGDAGQQRDENGKHPPPYGRNAVAIDEQDIQVDEDFDHDHGGVQDATRVEDEGDRHGERGKPIAKGAVDEGRKQRDRGEDDHGGVERRHLSRSPVLPRDPGAQ